MKPLFDSNRPIMLPEQEGLFPYNHILPRISPSKQLSQNSVGVLELIEQIDKQIEAQMFTERLHCAISADRS